MLTLRYLLTGEFMVWWKLALDRLEERDRLNEMIESSGDDVAELIALRDTAHHSYQMYSETNMYMQDVHRN